MLCFCSGNNIDFVRETKYFGVIMNLSMKTSDVIRQKRKFYAHANMLLRVLWTCLS